MQITFLNFAEQRGSDKSFGSQPVPRLEMDTWAILCHQGIWWESRPKNTVWSSWVFSLESQAGVLLKNFKGFPEKGREKVVWGKFLLEKSHWYVLINAWYSNSLWLRAYAVAKSQGWGILLFIYPRPQQFERTILQKQALLLVLFPFCFTFVFLSAVYF